MSEYIVEVNENPTITRDGWNMRCDDLFIQREPIVRCGDCCCCHTVDGHELCIRFNHATSPDGFCAWGERKEVDE